MFIALWAVLGLYSWLCGVWTISSEFSRGPGDHLPILPILPILPLQLILGPIGFVPVALAFRSRLRFWPRGNA